MPQTTLCELCGTWKEGTSFYQPFQNELEEIRDKSQYK